MTVLLLRLTGPMQAWGASSRFSRRGTEREPTKSGVLGLLAAAQGRRRTDPIEDLAGLSFGVRVDQEGSLLRDFHTAQRPDGTSMPLSRRFYLSDAKFVAALESSEHALLETLDHAVRHPQFPLFLGRRSCPPSEPLALGLRDGSLIDALAAERWHASAWYRRSLGPTVRLRVVRDGRPGEAARSMHDVPESFDPARRSYGWRSVVEDDAIEFENPDGTRDPHDPLAELTS